MDAPGGRSGRATFGRRLARLTGLGLVLAAANRASGVDVSRWLIGAQAVTRWALLPAHPLVIIAAARRWPGVAAVAAGLSAYQIALTRSARGARRPEPTPLGRTAVRLVSANLLLTNPTIEAAGRELNAQSIDVLALQELTPDHLTGLKASGLFDDLPYALISPEIGFHGAGLFSRWPMRDPELVDLDGVPMPIATIDTPDGPIRVAAVHAKNPGAVGELRRWQRQLAQLGSMIAAATVPTVLVGDFNATADHVDFRRLLANGLRDAYAVAGRGSGASWPVWPNLVPPLMRLDHALVTPEIRVLGVEARDTPGSDHRHLRVELAAAPRS